jgi:uncharacterized protein
MQLIDGTPVFSATDLVGYLACEHLTALESAALAGLVERPVRDDRELEVIRRRGLQHEVRYLEQLRSEGRNVVEIDRDDETDQGARIRAQAESTLAAMRDGVDVVYQATFFDGRWLGYADFLLRVEDPQHPSPWGDYHYEVADTKLARHVKAGAVLQMCSYVEQLERLQGVPPARMHVVLGGSAHETASLRVDDYMAYYRAARQRFEAVMLAGAPPVYPPADTYPEPVEHCDVCRWSELCAARRHADDHLSLVAGITARQRTALVGREIDTVVRLANAPIPFSPPLDGTSAASVERVREQARIQIQGRGLPKPIYELLEPPPGEPIEAERGLAMLPPPSDGDLFLDLEGDPYAFEDGIDYLFGVLDTEGTFTPIWATDPEHPSEITLAGEKAAFERVMDLLIERLAAFPDMHVYQYASYEPTALKRLMGRHATREDEVDSLLRGGVLVDLFRAVRQGLRASVESYSIKRIEALYDFARDVDLRDAGSSIVAFEEWLQLGDGDRPSSVILDEIARYNRDDVVSTARLRDWLEDRRAELADATGQSVPRPTPVSGDAPVDTAASEAHVAYVADALVAGVPLDRSERTAEQDARWLLAQLLSWHRREKKATYWEFFHRMELDATELTVDKGALGPLEVVGRVSEPSVPSARARLVRQVWRYRYPLQEYDIGSRSELYDPALRQAAPDAGMKAWRLPATIVGADAADGTIDLEWKGGFEAPQHPAGLVPLDVFQDGLHRQALLRLGEWVVEHGIDADGPWRAARDLLLRRAPRAGQPADGSLRQPGETELSAARRTASSLDHTTLAIQGPPGSGKTYTGARMIASLVARGGRVGISANSHKVIGNFITAVRAAALEEGVAIRIAQKVSEDGQGVGFDDVIVTKSNEVVRDGLRNGTLDVVGGTSWLWASDKSDGIVDVLFVDEAGQVALANVLATARAAASIVLLGDPQQLDQPLQGSHPPGADRSALAHLLDGRATISDELGLFLAHTHRLHPAITDFTSAAFYDDRLASVADLVAQTLRAPAPLRGAGVRYLPAAHVGADSVSRSEALQVAGLVRAIVESGASWTNRKGVEAPVSYDEVLVVAPYNAQVAQIASLLPPEARVGTVDKFQGQEAPISIYSMTSSSPEDAPRGMPFLYSRTRLNVATSRARCVAVVVAEPRLLRVRARTPEQMRLANALCRFVEEAGRA